MWRTSIRKLSNDWQLIERIVEVERAGSELYAYVSIERSKDPKISDLYSTVQYSTVLTYAKFGTLP